MKKSKIVKVVFLIIAYLHIPLGVYFHWWILFVCDKSSPGLLLFYFAGLCGIMASGFVFSLGGTFLLEE